MIAAIATVLVPVEKPQRRLVKFGHKEHFGPEIFCALPAGSVVPQKSRALVGQAVDQGVDLVRRSARGEKRRSPFQLGKKRGLGWNTLPFANSGSCSDTRVILSPSGVIATALKEAVWSAFTRARPKILSFTKMMSGLYEVLQFRRTRRQSFCRTGTQSAGHDCRGAGNGGP